MDNALNILTQLPPNPNVGFLKKPDLYCFGLSLAGSSHVERNIPCQDANGFRYLEDFGLFLCAVADGVGSCPLSHWGAQAAVRTAMDSVENKLRLTYKKQKVSLKEEESWIRFVLKEAFKEARYKVEWLAADQRCSACDLASTLTLTLYDGKVLACQHSGDGGAVALFENGDVRMVTRRIKEQDANRVYTLQNSSAKWEFYLAGKEEGRAVTAFALATDGVLDNFVPDSTHVHTPFLTSAFYASEAKQAPAEPKDALKHYLVHMNSAGYRRQVADDLTLLSVVNPLLLCKGKPSASGRKQSHSDANVKKV